MRHLLAGLFLLLLPAILAADAVPARPSRPAYVSLTQPFADFVDETRALPEAERVRLFRTRFDALFPGFYEPRDGLTNADYDAHTAQALARFPDIRADYERVERDFPAAFAAGIDHFRTRFPGFRPDVPIYLLHSLGEMDGGTRTIAGRNYLIFGADVIARVHRPGTLGPFLDHELFHVVNRRRFADCDPVWCTLWIEGLATYAAWVMNPGASDRDLLLDVPRPIRAPVDADWRRALCLIYAKRDSADPDDSRIFFTGAAAPEGLPPRYGYYVGLKVLQRIGRGRSLAEMSRLDNASARRLLEAELGQMTQAAGGCPAGGDGGQKVPVAR